MLAPACTVAVVVTLSDVLDVESSWLEPMSVGVVLFPAVCSFS
jgi:hypothetical protein